MTEENDWSQDFNNSKPKTSNFKLEIDETAKIMDFEGNKVLGVEADFTFKDEGIKDHSEEYGDSIKFSILDARDNLLKSWYVSLRLWSLLKEISLHKPLKGKAAKLTRIGSGRKDTRRFIKFL
jgi:hypothetical protein